MKNKNQYIIITIGIVIIALLLSIIILMFTKKTDNKLGDSSNTTNQESVYTDTTKETQSIQDKEDEKIIQEWLKENIHYSESNYFKVENNSKGFVHKPYMLNSKYELVCMDNNSDFRIYLIENCGYIAIYGSENIIYKEEQTMLGTNMFSEFGESGDTRLNSIFIQYTPIIDTEEKSEEYKNIIINTIQGCLFQKVTEMNSYTTLCEEEFFYTKYPCGVIEGGTNNGKFIIIRTTEEELIAVENGYGFLWDTSGHVMQNPSLGNIVCAIGYSKVDNKYVEYCTHESIFCDCGNKCPVYITDSRLAVYSDRYNKFTFIEQSLGNKINN